MKILTTKYVFNDDVREGMKMKLKDLKIGDYFTLKEVEEPTGEQVYIKGEYDRESKSFSCEKFSDTNAERTFKSDKEVYTDFIF